ncbi:zinc finger protein with KRAB and SCAN domains 2-like [Periophthalmus magnuspinnatus]|uniref:zinc finger protein with KRAB and SCAN domains 2-like n=1 Tax=Periophthalmus magnuspinnatus TaxID=409849 RepID=UPI00145BD65B|nr:zinc finger protein with KRAB and SCAN domains 2-like [Periophthalmus magnuspinnatus]
MGRGKQYWSVAETICLLEIWSSSENKQRHKGATRTKEQYEQIQRELAAQGHERALQQIVNKIKKLKMEFKEQTFHSKQGRDYWVQKNPYYEVLECAFGSREEQSMQLEDYFVHQSPTDNDVDTWRDSCSMQETDCLLKICTDAELHQRLGSPCTPKDIIEDIQKEMRVQGYDLTSEQIVDKLKTLKREYRVQKNNLDQETEISQGTIIGLDVVDFIVGDKEDCIPQNTETIKTEPPDDDELLNTSTNTVQKINNDKWIDAEVQALLSVYAATKMQQDFEGQKKNSKIFEKISKELENFGIHHTPKQCREKVKKLKQDYKKIKDYNNLSGAEIKTGKWYDILDSILGHHPLYSATPVPMSENSVEELMESTSTEREGLKSFCSDNNVMTRGNSEAPYILGSESCDPDSKSVLQLSIDAALCSSDLKIVHVLSGTSESSPYSSLPLPRPLLKNNDKWIDAEVQALLSVYATTKMNGDYEGQRKNSKIFEKISKELENFGVHHTPKQCREKVKKLKQDYKKIKDYNNLSGAEIKTGKWYDILDSILGHHPLYSATPMPMSENSVEELMESTSTENNLQSREGPKPICSDNNAESIDSSEESAPEPEQSLGQFPCTEQYQAGNSNPCHPTVRSMPFRFRSGKRKRKESTDLVECLERMQERYLQHSREMHEALLSKMDTHMTAVIGLLGRMASAVEAQVAK